MKYEDAQYQRTLLTTPTSGTTESGIEMKDTAIAGKPSDDIQVGFIYFLTISVGLIFVVDFALSDSSRFNNQREKETTFGVAAETPLGMLLCQIDSQKESPERGSSKFVSDNGTSCLSFNM